MVVVKPESIQGTLGVKLDYTLEGCMEPYHTHNHSKGKP